MTRRPWRRYAARAIFASHHLFVLPSLKKSTLVPPLSWPFFTHEFCCRFENQGWPPWIDDPLGNRSELGFEKRLHNAVYGLNHGGKPHLIRLFCDGTHPQGRLGRVADRRARRSPASHRKLHVRLVSRAFDKHFQKRKIRLSCGA